MSRHRTGRPRLTFEQVEYARTHREVGHAALARRFGVAASTIKRLRSGRSWPAPEPIAADEGEMRLLVLLWVHPGLTARQVAFETDRADMRVQHELLTMFRSKLLDRGGGERLGARGTKPFTYHLSRRGRALVMCYLDRIESMEQGNE